MTIAADLHDLSWMSDYMDIPYVEHGRTHAGADCWGVTRLILLEQRGWELPVLRLVASMPVGQQDELLRKESRTAWRVLAENELPQIWDVIIYESAGTLHAGLMLNAEDYCSMTPVGMIGDSLSNRIAFKRRRTRIYRKCGQ